MMLFEKVSSLYHFKSDLGEIWHDRSSNKYALIDGIWIFDAMSYFQDNGHDVRPQPVADAAW